MDEYIIKHLLKKNKKMSKSEAEKRAAKIWDAYCEVNKQQMIMYDLLEKFLIQLTNIRALLCR